MGLFGGNGGDAASPPVPSPFDGLGDDNPLSVQADETAARWLDTGFATEVRGLVHDPATGLAGRDPEAALAGIAETIPLLADLKDRYLSQARGPRQKALLEPLIDRRLERAGVNLGRIVYQATSVLDDRSVANRIADLQRDASLSWQDKAHLRLLGRTVVNELRYQGERKGWDAGRTDTAVRTGLSDLYAGAVEAAIVQDPERAATLYDHARVVIQPERQAAVERKIQRANEEWRVTEIVGGLADTPDDPTRRPELDDYQARAAEATPPDASPEVRAQVTRMMGIEHVRADQAWQAKRGRAATGALDWLGANPTAPLMAMPAALRDGLSPEQTEALDRTAMNGGRVVTDRDLYDRLDDQAVRDPESFTGLDLTQHRLSLGDSDYNRLTDRQQTLAEGKPDPAFERHRLGRLFLEEGLRAANLDPNGAEARPARQQLDTLLGAFEAVEGKPPTMADIRHLVGDVLPRANGDPAEAPPQEAVDTASPPPLANQAVAEESARTNPIEPTHPTPPAPEVTRFDDGTTLVTRRGVDTDRGKAEVTESYDEQDRIVSTDAIFADGYRVESRWSYPAEGRRSQVDTVRDPEGQTLGAITTTFDGERVTRTVEPINGQPQTDIWDKDGPVPTMQNVVAPALAIPILLDLVAAAIGAVIVGKAIDDTIARQGMGGASSGRTYDHFTAPDITIAPTLPADDNPPDDETGSGRRSRWRYEGGNDQQPEGEPPPRPPEYRKRKAGMSKKEKKDNIPEWAIQLRARPRVGEDGKTAAERYMDQHHGKGNWSRTGPGSEFSRMKKFFDKAFEK